MSDVRIETDSFSWDSWPYQKVSAIQSLSVFIAHLSGVAKKEYASDVDFRKFRHQLFHSSLAKILEPVKPGMTTPEMVCCPDSHYRRAIYGLGPYITDYPEQALLACIVQGWCPK